MTGNDITAAICRFARSAIHARGIVFLVMVITAACSVGIAGPPVNKAIEKEADKIRVVLQANFQAINEENLPVLMGTLDRQLPKRDEFEQEARAVFADVDMYMRVKEFELLEVRGPWAAARVVQLTLPANENARELGTDRQMFYRQNSMLLPEYDLVEYTQMFHKSGGKWRLWLVTTQPQPAQGATQPAGATLSAETGPAVSGSVFGGCANGRCRTR